MDIDTRDFVAKFNEDPLRPSRPMIASDEESKLFYTNKILEQMTFDIAADVPLETGKNSKVVFRFAFKNIEYVNERQKRMDATGKDVFYPVLPNMARSQDSNYELLLYVDIEQKMFIDKGGGREMAVENGSRVYERRHLTNVPLMVMSQFCPLRSSLGKVPLDLLGECPHERGGYYVMKKDITFKFGEEILGNYAFYSKTKKFEHEVSTKSVDPDRYSQMYKFHMIFIDEYSTKSSDTPFGPEDVEFIRDRVIEVVIPSVLQKRIPLYILFRAYGILTDADITSIILGSDIQKRPDLVDFLVPSMEAASGVKTQEQAIEFVFGSMYSDSLRDGRRKGYTVSEIVNDILLHQILMHTGTDSRAKTVFLGHMARKLIRGVLGEIPYDDRDDYAFKRYTGPSRKLSDTFYFSILDIVSSLQTAATNDLNRAISRKAGAKDILDILAGYSFSAFDMITSKPTAKFSVYMSQGKFPVKTRKDTKRKYEEGVTEKKTESTNYVERIMAVRRLNFATPSARLKGKPNALHPTQWGFVCPYETPDGHNIGTLKHMAMGTTITTEKGRENEIVSKLVAKLDGIVLVSQVPPRESGSGTPIMHNGIPLAYAKDPFAFDDQMRRARRKGLLPEGTSCFYDIYDRAYYIWSSTGRLSRPVMTVYRDKDGNVSIPAIEYMKTAAFKNEPFDAFVFDTDKRPALIEYIDAHEAKNRLIAESPVQVLKHDALRRERKTYYKYDFCEIHPLFVIGYSAGLIPYINYMPYPRALYQATPLQKNMLGMPFTNILGRSDKTSQMLMFPMHPHVRTATYDTMKLRDIPSLTVPIIAICDATGFNQEDSIVMNAASIRRGMFSLVYFKRYSQKEDREAAGEGAKIFCNPLTLSSSVSNPEIYHALTETGIPKVNTLIRDGDVIISMVSLGASGEKLHPRDTVYHGSPGYIDMVDKIGPDSQPQSINVRVRIVRDIQVGDKFASRYAQKGTCALILPPEEMPVSETGIVPDILVNLHAMPSRSTVGHIQEMLAGRMAALYGMTVDATPFTKTPDIDALNDKIKEYFDIAEFSEETMVDGMTGMRNRARIFMGPIAYQRMKQMVEDKFHVREVKGKTVNLTRQPTEGRAKDGGKRFGEMERDGAAAHGVAAFINELLMKGSDEFSAYVCRTCGFLATYKSETGESSCGVCRERADVCRVQTAYAFKLMLQEMYSAGIAMRLILSDA